MEMRSIKINVDERVIKGLRVFLDLETVKGIRMNVEHEFCHRILSALNRGEEEITLRFPLRPGEVREETEPGDNPGEIVPPEVAEAVRVMKAIIESQRKTKEEENRPQYDALGPDSHGTLLEKGVEVPEGSPFRFETAWERDHFLVIATAFPGSGLTGKVFYESSTGN